MNKNVFPGNEVLLLLTLLSIPLQERLVSAVSVLEFLTVFIALENPDGT